MNDSASTTPPVSRRQVFGCVTKILIAGGGLFVIAVMFGVIGNLVILELAIALATGWVRHGLRVLPDFFAQWPPAIVPLAALALTWWTGHRLLRWWLAARGSAMTQAWGIGRSAAVLGLVLLCGAAAIAISGVAHQMMWLGQTQWTQDNRRSDFTVTLNQTRMMAMVLTEFDVMHGRLPHSWDELIDADIHDSFLLREMIRHGNFPLLVQPGASLSEINPWSIVTISERVNDRHVLGLANGSVTSVPPKQLEAIVASGEMRYQNEQ